ncbi:MAG: efflux RND transporter periplasmic adaptor subunit [Spirochaetes bacterium]|nr:efflux RND transporter periplasmic adaptor subunit [Spirochaetota bacterium]
MDRKKMIPLAIIVLALTLSILYFEVFRHLFIDDSRIEGSGTIEVTEIDIGSKIAGRVTFISKNEGERVARGETVARLDSDELDAQRLSVAAYLNNARSNMERVEKLFRAGSVSRKDYDQMVTAFRVAKANNELVNATIENAVIISPVNGIVMEKNLEVGEMAFPGTPVLTVADLTKAWIKIYVTQPNLGFIKLGQKASVFIDSYPQKAFPGRVVAVSNRAEFTPKTIETKDERTKLMFAIKIAVDNPDLILKPGMPADAIIMVEKKR